MKLKDIGERALLEIAREICAKGPNVEVGVGDDAAAMDIGDEHLVITTDMLIGHVHFPPGTPVEQIGRKAMIVNLSDLAAMGANPLGLVFSIGAPRDTEADFIEKLLESMNSQAKKYDAYLVGGDLNESKDIIISGTAFGRIPKDQLLTRSGAQAGDVIAVTGDLGGATAGVKILVEGLRQEGYEELVKAFTEPTARIEVGRILAESGGTTSAIDVTDGLAANLWQISRMSKVKLIIDEEKLPINPIVEKFSKEHDFDLEDFTLFGGEDFELLFTVKKEAWDSVKKAIEDQRIQVTVIGEVSKGSGVYVKKNGKEEELPDRGYEHFR